MARQPQLIGTEEETITIEGNAEDISELAGDLGKQEDDVLSEFDANDANVTWKVKIYRLVPKSTAREWCFDCLPSDFPILDYIRENFGAGTYQAYCYRNKKLRRVLDYKIAELRKGLAGAAQRAEDSPLSQSVRMQGELLKELTAQLAAIKHAPAAPADPMGMFQGMLAAMVSFKELLTPAKSSGDGLNLFLKGIEVTQALAEEGREKGLMDILGDVLTKTPLLENLSAGLSPPTAPSKPRADAPPAPPTAEQFQQAQIAQIQGVVAYLITRAQKNADPALYADWILDNAPPMILPMLEAPGALEMLAQLHPPLLTYRQWFEALLKALLDPAETPEPAHVLRNGAAAVADNFDPQWAAGSTGNFEGDEPDGEGGQA